MANCNTCEKTLVGRQKRFCSRSCTHIGFSGDKNPMFTNAKLIAVCRTCDKRFSYYSSCSEGKYCSTRCSFDSSEWLERQRKSKLGKKASIETRMKMSRSAKGKVLTEEHKLKIRNATKGVAKPHTRGEKSPSWRGGATERSRGLRATPEYRDWRKFIVERDKGACVRCKSTTSIHVDHIIPFASLLEEARVTGNNRGIFDTDNGQVLCKECHIRTQSWSQKMPQQLEARLILGIENLWSKEPRTVPLDRFYDRVMEQFIEQIKSKLES